MSKKRDQTSLVDICSQITGATPGEPFVITYPIGTTPDMQDFIIDTLSRYGFKVVRVEDEFMDYSKSIVYWL